MPELFTASSCCLTKRQERNRDDYREGNAYPPGYGDLISAGVWRWVRNRDMEGRSYVLIADETGLTVPLLRITGIKRHGFRHQRERRRCGRRAAMRGMVRHVMIAVAIHAIRALPGGARDHGIPAKASATTMGAPQSGQR